MQGSLKDNKFKTGYDFRKDNKGFNDPYWAIGKADISGEFIPNSESIEGGKKILKGKIIFNFSDTFNSPYDVMNILPNGWDANFGGKPYKIEDKWEVDGVLIKINK